MKDRVLNLIRDNPSFSKLYSERMKGRRGYDYDLTCNIQTSDSKTVHFEWMGMHITYQVSTDSIRVYYKGLEAAEHSYVKYSS